MINFFFEKYANEFNNYKDSYSKLYKRQKIEIDADNYAAKVIATTFNERYLKGITYRTISFINLKKNILKSRTRYENT